MKKDKKKGRQAPGGQRRTSNISLEPSKPEITWIIEPHDPLIVRDGRPFGPDPSARAESLSFPFPSTTTGGARTRAGLKADGMFDMSQIERVKQIEVRGPLLVQLTQIGDAIEKWLVPAPADALLLESKKKGYVLCKQLVPLKVYGGTETVSTKDDKPFAPPKPDEGADTISTKDSTSLMLVGQVQPDASKPSKDARSYWYWDVFKNWLVNPSDQEWLIDYSDDEPSLANLGDVGPSREYRLHVSMNPETLTAKDGALFETSGLEFTSIAAGKDKETRMSRARRLALAVIVDRRKASSIRGGFASLGGERRMVSWRRSGGDSDLLECPSELQTAIIKNKACRVLLLTPACFEQGYRPGWLVRPRDGVQPNLEAIAIQRPKIVSGWKLEPPVGPKPTRRLAPAGTVFFLSLEGDDKAIKSWVDGIWMQCISDKVEDRNDGFGLTVLGSWSGKPEVMEEAK